MRNQSMWIFVEPKLVKLDKNSLFRTMKELMEFALCSTSCAFDGAVSGSATH